MEACHFKTGFLETHPFMELIRERKFFPIFESIMLVKQNNKRFDYEIPMQLVCEYQYCLKTHLFSQLNY